MLDDELLFTVTDLKQYTYCQRVTYYEHCLPHIRPRTYKMDAGRDAHEREQKLAARRSLARYNLVDGERFFDVALRAADLHLHGELDELIRTPSGALIPVDYKLAKRASHNHRIQLTAYAVLLEVVHSVDVSHGFVYLIPKKQAVKVTITPQRRQEVLDMLERMHAMVRAEACPEPVAQIRKCMGCEFRRFCNDV